MRLWLAMYGSVPHPGFADAKEEGRRVPWSAMVQVLYSQFACEKIIMSWPKQEGWSGTVHSQIVCNKIITSSLCLGSPVWYDDVHKTPNFTLFVSKHPSVVSCTSCTSKCPPHNVFHSVTKYPEYYDPLYFPECHVSLFESETAICAWLLNNFPLFVLLVLHCILCVKISKIQCVIFRIFLLSVLPALIFESLRLWLSPLCFPFVAYIVVWWYWGTNCHLHLHLLRNGTSTGLCQYIWRCPHGLFVKGICICGAL